jgi:hypothetical protein
MYPSLGTNHLLPCTYNLVPVILTTADGAHSAKYKMNWLLKHPFINTQKPHKMVTISAFHEVLRTDGSTFISLELTGSAELIQSQNTGKWYATVRKCRIPSTFDANIAQTMIGQRLPGEIVRVICEPYEFLNKRTGEVMKLQHSYAYTQDSKQENAIGHTRVMEVASL